MKWIKVVVLLGMCMAVFTACKGKADVGSVSELEQEVKAVEEVIHGERSESSVQDTGVSRDGREGTSGSTVATPEDFPKEYDYGSGRVSDLSREDMFRKMPKPAGNETVLNTAPNPEGIQALYLWDEGNMDPDWLSEGELPPTFYVYGTEDPFYSQFEEQYEVMRNLVKTERIVLNNWPHGFGSDGGWVEDYARWLEEIFQSGSRASETADEKEGLEMFTPETKIQEVVRDPAFEGFGRLIFPVDLGLEGGLTLREMGSRLMWYSHVNPERTVSIVNEMKARAEGGEQIFYEIYTDEEKKRDPSKEDTGLFYFRGNPGEKFAVVNAGGGFMYVAAMHDSFPHMQELAARGYNAFALIYRPGAETACEDLARAIAFIHEHAEELQVNMEDYSLWGGSAGARMAAWLGSYGTAAFGEKAYPAPGAVIMQYTGLSEVYGNEPPTYACVGTNDGIASYRTMERRIKGIKANGTAGEIEVFDGLSHGFGLGEGTAAEGWIDRAAAFWEENAEYSCSRK